MTSTINYQGGLRTEATHQASATKLITDAPVDNHGKGAAFSPTDLVATALGSCILTIMGIKAEALGVNLKDTKVSVVKEMAANPRRIATLKIDLHMPLPLTTKTKQRLERAALSCPVAQSLHPELKQEIRFHWLD